MAGFETVCVAAVQATPVILDADATFDKAIGLLGEAVDAGADPGRLPGVLRVGVSERGVGSASGELDRGL